MFGTREEKSLGEISLIQKDKHGVNSLIIGYGYKIQDKYAKIHRLRDAR